MINICIYFVFVFLIQYIWKLKVINHSTILVCCDVWLETNINCVPRWLRPSLLLKQGPTGYEQRRETSSQREHVFLFSNLLYLYFQISCICIFKSLVFVFSSLLDLNYQIYCICIFKYLVFVVSSLLDLNCQIYCICVSVCICITMQVGQWIWTKGRSKGEIVVRWDRQFDADLINIRWKYKYLTTNTNTQIQKERLCLRRIQRNQNKS